MPRRKSKTLRFAYRQWRIADLAMRVRLRMRSLPGPTPPDMQRALSVLLLAHEAPEVIVEDSASDLRHELAMLIAQFGQFTLAALWCLYRKAKTAKVGAKRTATVREFLLTRRSVRLPNGKDLPIDGATDDEIADAIQRETGIVASGNLVKSERSRLERVCGSSIREYVEFQLKVTSQLEALYPQKQRAKVRRARRQAATTALYKSL